MLDGIETSRGGDDRHKTTTDEIGGGLMTIIILNLEPSMLNL